MNTQLLKIIFYLLLGIMLYQLAKTPIIENFKGFPNVILIGNIFGDQDHTRYLSIKEKLTRDPNLHLGHLISLDDKCSTLGDFKKSIKELKRTNPELDSNNTFAFISIGFHDLISNVYNCEEAITVEPYSSPNAGMSKKLPCHTETDIFNSWKEELEHFRNQFPKVNIIVMSAYYLPDEKAIEECGLKLTPNRELHTDIDHWNADLAQFCLSKNLGFIAMDEEFKVSDVIVGSIDFKNTAKRHLVNLIKRKIH